MSRVYEIWSGTCSLDENFLERVQEMRSTLSKGEDDTLLTVTVRRILLSNQHYRAIEELVRGKKVLAEVDSVFLKTLLTAMDPITRYEYMSLAQEGELCIGYMYGLPVYAQIENVRNSRRLEPWGYTIEVSVE